MKTERGQQLAHRLDYIVLYSSNLFVYLEAYGTKKHNVKNKVQSYSKKFGKLVLQIYIQNCILRNKN